ncbi:MAG: hypothetical protein HYX46_02855 [Betaproteobacteria bacterium]|nr:hypothetical protein [Betaproteobacteria bacterium]
MEIHKTHRIKVKLGDAEFDAEGSEEAVQAQYDAFLAAVSSLPKAATQAGLNATLGAATLNATATVSPAPQVLDRVFRRGEILSLAALPSGDNAVPDAMLAILYGHMKLEGEQAVTGTMLMKSAKKSGVTLDRVDRVVEPLMPKYVAAAGVKKARRYQLNNPGIARAEEIIKAILQ